MTEADFPEFRPWPKITRKNRSVVVTEKIDGTNACVVVTDDGRVFAQSRTRFVTPESDNYGFAKWVKDREAELRDGLGHGYHYGEWMGQGIQRGYGLKERRFYLFNAGRWGANQTPPECCHVVPILGIGFEKDGIAERCLEDLRANGSRITPGFRAEGIVIYHTASGNYTKVTIDNDESPKGLVGAQEAGI